MRIFFDETITQYRLESTDNKTENYEYLGEIQGAIRPVKAEDVMLAEGIPYETFKLYCEDYTDIKEGDKLMSVLYGGTSERLLQNVDMDNIVTVDGSNIVLEISNEYVVKIVRRYQLKNINRVECYLTLLK